MAMPLLAAVRTKRNAFRKERCAENRSDSPRPASGCPGVKSPDAYLFGDGRVVQRIVRKGTAKRPFIDKPSSGDTPGAVLLLVTLSIAHSQGRTHKNKSDLCACTTQHASVGKDHL